MPWIAGRSPVPFLQRAENTTALCAETGHSLPRGSLHGRIEVVLILAHLRWRRPTCLMPADTPQNYHCLLNNDHNRAQLRGQCCRQYQLRSLLASRRPLSPKCMRSTYTAGTDVALSTRRRPQRSAELENRRATTVTEPVASGAARLIRPGETDYHALNAMLTV